jgi:hypothetical protein
MIDGSLGPAQQIDLANGPVTLEPLDKLVARLEQLNTEARQLLQGSEAPTRAATEKLERAGQVLLTHKGEWDANSVADQVNQAAQLQTELAQLSSQIQDLAGRHTGGLGGFFRSLADGPHVHQLEAKRGKIFDQLEGALATLAGKAPASTVPEADALRSEVEQLLAQAKSMIDQEHAKVEEGKAVADEVDRRQAAAKQMGFDSLYTVAWLQAHGPAPVASPLVLKAKEQAYVSLPAVLSRVTTRTRFVGGSQGLSFPIAHTGIRYRVGSFSGRPVQSTSLADVDAGTLVLTNRRLVFIGKVKSVVTQLPKIVHVESYTDALAVFQEGRENPNFYKLGSPQYCLLYLNWLLDHQGG